MSEKETKMQSFRLSTSAVESFRAYCDENGISRAEGFDSLLRLAEIEKHNKEIADLKEKNRKLQQELAVFKKYDFDDEDVDVWEV